MSSQFGLDSGCAYLLPGAVATLIPAWINRELAGVIG